jgi:hypothetical protein
VYKAGQQFYFGCCQFELVVVLSRKFTSLLLCFIDEKTECAQTGTPETVLAVTSKSGPSRRIARSAAADRNFTHEIFFSHFPSSHIFSNFQLGDLLVENHGEFFTMRRKLEFAAMIWMGILIGGCSFTQVHLSFTLLY